MNFIAAVRRSVWLPDPRYASNRIVHLFALIVEEEAGADRRGFIEAKRELKESGFGAISRISLRGIEKSRFRTVNENICSQAHDLDIKAGELFHNGSIGRRKSTLLHSWHA